MKPSILLQTDFSNTWGAVASMKGVIKIVDPKLDIQDLCHDIKTYDVWEASLSLMAVVPYWPDNTVVVSVVDPGVGTKRKASVALLNDGKYVVTPDNGSLTHLVHTIGIKEIREIDDRKYRFDAKEEVSVFHGRDIFGYCAALLASGKVRFEDIGKAYPVSQVVMCEEFFIKNKIEDGVIHSWIMTGLKHFGGIQLGITNEEFVGLGYKIGDDFDIIIKHGGETVFNKRVPFVASFGYVEKGMPLLYEGSSKYLSLDCNQASFMDSYNVGMGKEWTVSLEKAND